MHVYGIERYLPIYCCVIDNAYWYGCTQIVFDRLKVTFVRYFALTFLLNTNLDILRGQKRAEQLHDDLYLFMTAKTFQKDIQPLITLF